MAEITFIAYDADCLGEYYQFQVRSKTDIFDGEAKNELLCFGSSDLVEFIRNSIPIIRHCLKHEDELGVVMIGKFPLMGYKAIHNQVDRLTDDFGKKAYYHENYLEII